VKKRKDGTLLKNIDPMRKLMPYLFKTRNESVVYAPEEIQFDAAKEYIRQLNKNNPSLKIGTFEVVLSAIIRTFCRFPYLNRFVSGKKLYARNSLSISFVVLKLIDGLYKESTAKVYFNKEDTIFDVSKKVNASIALCHSNISKEDDKLMNFVTKFPSPLLTFIAFILNKFSNWGILSKVLLDIIPLYSSVFISNLGSIGHDAIHHHLYDWGTTSVFITMGKITKKDNKHFLNVVYSIDERIADGIYLVKALRYFSHLIKNPRELESPPNSVIEDDGIY